MQRFFVTLIGLSFIPLLSACGSDDTDDTNDDGSDDSSGNTLDDDSGADASDDDTTGSDSGADSAGDGTDDGTEDAGTDDGGTGTGGVCDPEPGDDECIMCTKTNCCSELEDCRADTVCTCITDCLDEMGPSGLAACQTMCGSSEAFSPFSTCVFGSCTTQCL